MELGTGAALSCRERQGRKEERRAWIVHKSLDQVSSMSKVRVVLAVAAVATMLSVCSSSAQAQTWGGGRFYGFGGWNSGPLGLNSTPYGLGQVPVPPYFALHPPVYYSHPVKAAYGLSPYAALPRVAQATPEPELVMNPFITEEEREAKPDVDQVTQAEPKPRMILNPFVSQEEILASTIGK